MLAPRKRRDHDEPTPLFQPKVEGDRPAAGQHGAAFAHLAYRAKRLAECRTLRDLDDVTVRPVRTGHDQFDAEQRGGAEGETFRTWGSPPGSL
jgi:hypothetical protein